MTARHLWDASCFGCVSFIVGYFPNLFPNHLYYLIASSFGMVGHFLTPCCCENFNKNERKVNDSLLCSHSCCILQFFGVFFARCAGRTFVCLLVDQHLCSFLFATFFKFVCSVPKSLKETIWFWTLMHGISELFRKFGEIYSLQILWHLASLPVLFSNDKSAGAHAHVWQHNFQIAEVKAKLFPSGTRYLDEWLLKRQWAWFWESQLSLSLREPNAALAQWKENRA